MLLWPGYEIVLLVIEWQNDGKVMPTIICFLDNISYLNEKSVILTRNNKYIKQSVVKEGGIEFVEKVVNAVKNYGNACKIKLRENGK